MIHVIKRIVLIAIACMVISLIGMYSAKAQNTLFSQGFEGACANWSFTGGDVSTLTERTGGHSARIGNASSSLTFSPANVTGYSGLVLTIYHSVRPAPGPGLDTREGAVIQVSINGGAFTTIGSVSGFSDAAWGFNSSSGGTTAASAGCNTFTMPNPLVYAVPAGATSVQARVVSVKAGTCNAFNTAMANATPSVYDRADEGIYIDDVSITTSSTISPPLTLLSPVGTDNQNIIACTNKPIDDIQYAIGMGGGTVTGLPPGVTYSVSGNVLTITGTPATDGTFNYTIKDICTGQTLTRTISKSTPVLDSLIPISVCAANLPYTWNGSSYNTGGSYDYHTTSVAGCDSTVTLVLTILNTTTSSTPASICRNNLPYTWNGTPYTASGSYDYHTTNAVGCDSTATVVLTVLDTTISSTPAKVCRNNLPYLWNGTPYNTSGSYDYHTTNAAGCDSIATVVLSVLDTSISNTPKSICRADLPYVWNGTPYTVAGSYDFHTTNAAGCDSIATLMLTILEATKSSTPKSICSKDLPYVWNGTPYNIAGSYDYHTTNASGCDSTATVVLTVLQETSSSTPESICSNNLPYSWNGATYNITGSYDYHTTNAAGCDSTATLVLTVLNTTSSSTPKSVCNKDLPYVWNGTPYNTMGSYDYHTTNAAGCDSTATLVLTVLQETSSSTPKSVCNKDLPYVWNGVSYNVGGSYDYHTTNAAGCDSTATLVLTVLKETSSSTPKSVCNKDLPYVWNGASYNIAGSYDYHTTNAAGCDSTATLVLTVLKETSSSTPKSICSNNLPYSWNGATYNATGSYDYHTTNAAGCDSIATLILTVLNTTSSSTPKSVCNKDLPYVWNGTPYNTMGSYDYHTMNAAGCDSTATLVLTVLQETSSSTPKSVCNKDLPYVWNGKFYNTAGSYDYHTTNAAGCDSIATLVLTVLQETKSSTSKSICSNDLPYSWNGKSYNVAGSYDYHTTNAAGCDSTATLVLAIVTATISSTPAKICAADLPYVWNGASYNKAGNYIYHTTNAAGCDSTATLVLNVLNATASSTPIKICTADLPYLWNGVAYNASGSYDYHTINAVGCDSTATLILTVLNASTSNKPVTVCSTALPYSWNGTAYNTAGTYNYHTTNIAGCDSTATLVLTIATPTTSITPVTICKSKLPYFWNNQPYTTPGNYTAHLINAAGCDSAATVQLNIVNEDLDLKLQSSDNNVFPGTQISLTTSSPSAYSITGWRPSASFPLQNELSQNIIAKQSMDIIVFARSPEGCADTATLQLVVKDVNDFFVPNAFAPNGANNFFSVYGSAISSGRLMVYNQWGELIFDTQDIKKGWDGSYRGIQQPAGVYNYIVSAILFNGSVINTKGHINLIR